MPKQLFSDIMLNMEYQNCSMQDLVGQFFINGKPQVYVSYYDIASGYSVKRDIRVKYFAASNGVPDKIKAQYYTLDKRNNRGVNSWIDCDEEQYNDFNNQLTLSGLFSDNIQLTRKDSSKPFGNVAVLRPSTGMKSKKLVFTESEVLKEMCDFTLYDRLPENTVLLADTGEINLQIEHRYDSVIKTSMMNMMLNNYLVTTKSLNSRIGYSDLILPMQSAYLPFMYHGSKVRCPILESTEYRTRYEEIFGELDRAAMDIQIFPGIPESQIACKVITNKKACEILGLNTVYPLTGYILAYIVTHICVGMRLDLPLLINSEVEYFSQYLNEIKLHFGSIDQFRASLEADLSSALGVG